MLKSKVALCFAIGAAVAVGSFSSPDVAEAQVAAEIVGFTYGGSGCPAGSLGWVWNDASKTLTLDFDEFATTAPPGRSKGCTLSFVLRVPSPYQISLDRVEYLGYIDTEPAVSGQLRRKYKQGSHAPQSFVEDFAPGTQDDYHIVDEVPWSTECTTQETVLMNARIDLHGNPTRENEMVLDALQYGTKVVFYFGLLPC